MCVVYVKVSAGLEITIGLISYAQRVHFRGAEFQTHRLECESKVIRPTLARRYGTYVLEQDALLPAVLLHPKSRWSPMVAELVLICSRVR